MTQKELLYFEDAVMHEEAIISIIEESLNNISNSECSTFLKKELKKHNKNKEELLNYLKGEC